MAASESNASNGHGGQPFPFAITHGYASNHDAVPVGSSSSQPDSLRKRLNVDSPSFTPGAPNLKPTLESKSATISPKAAFAAPFTPKSSRTSTPFTIHAESSTSEWSNQDFPEFVPQNLDPSQLVDNSSVASYQSYDSYDSSGTVLESPSINHQTQINPYAHDTSTAGSAAYYPGQNNHYIPPLNYHLYSPIAPHRENLPPFQRTPHDFFIADDIREDLQRKSEATLQVLPNSTLPGAVEYFHSLVPLDTNNQRSTATFGFPTWVYKAISKKDGYAYVLRRLEGFKLTNEKAILSIKTWKRIDNGSVVSIHDAFTTGVFGDRSLIIVMDYHPLSKTLAEQHFSYTSRYPGSRASGTLISEQVLWGHLVQISSALKAIHGAGLAARIITPAKVLLTSKNRIRLSGCGIMDVVYYDQSANLQELQQDDLTKLGQLVLSLATHNTNVSQSPRRALDLLARTYSTTFKDAVSWLFGVTGSVSPRTIDSFLSGITEHVVTILDNTLHDVDNLVANLGRELENSRLVRLLTKLNLITERPDFDHQRQWSETGERYYLKLFRDYVFHQVDAEGRPVVSLGFIISTLNKLDASSEEKICLMSRDEQNVFVVSFKEVKRGIETAFQELVKAGRRM